MTATMSCRGPDASDTWLSPHAAFGHCRLAVIDLPGGHQPMRASTAGGEIVLVYSGECYNYLELRAELISLGHEFSTQSDTEVVLQAYLRWGAQVVQHLNGMFAFAVWDERREELLLARDRLGVKPLYYFATDDGVLFGSEPKAILANPNANRAVDLDGLRELFMCTKAPGWALWKDMHEVEPGTTLRVTRNGLSEQTYWRLETADHRDDRDTTVEAVRDLFADIIKQQLVSDVPLSVLLSGGLDSSAITGFAARELAGAGEKIRTISVDFLGTDGQFVPDEVRDTSDGPFIRDVVELVGSDHQDVVLTNAELADPTVRRAMITARDIPAGIGDLDVSLYLLFKAARESTTVALSGESADEIFGGYRWFHDDTANNIENFPWLAFQSSHSDRVGLLRGDLVRQLDVGTYTADQYRTAVAAVDQPAYSSRPEQRMRIFCHLHLTRFLRIWLDRKDRASMAVGLEVRVPFCDHRLVSYVYNTPWSMKTFDGREKSLLRHAAKHVLPESVVRRVKSAYPSTHDPGYAAALIEQAREVLADRSNPVFDLVDHSWLANALEFDATSMPLGVRHGIDRVLDLYHWIDIYRPRLIFD